jgi:cell division protein FtsI (penicillin-binding protein 3)
MKPVGVEKKRVDMRNRRIAFIGVVFTLLYAIVGIRAFHLQVIQREMLSERASGEYSKALKQTGKRGTIYDAKLRELALSTNVVSVGVNPKRINGDKKPALAKIIAEQLGMDRHAIEHLLLSKDKFTWIDRSVLPAQASALQTQLRAEKITQIEFVPSYCRIYPNRTLAAQLIGFTNIDEKGTTGLEFQYNECLQGEMMYWSVIKDAKGNIINQDRICEVSHEGNSLELNIDTVIQSISENALKRAVEENNAKSGIAVVMEPKTGAVKAIAHFPTFNPNAFNSSPSENWRNRAIADQFEPGSTLKIFLAAAALESKLFTPDSVVSCENGRYRIGRNVIRDTKPHDDLTLLEIIAVSSNIGTAKVAQQIGPAALYHVLAGFGFGERTGIDFPGEASGMLRDYRAWKPIDHATIAFGQGVTVTAIQLATAVAAIANDGILMKPQIVRAIRDGNGNIVRSFEPEVLRRVISSRTVELLKTMMLAATEKGGTGTLAVPAGYSVCGKTGTAQKLNEAGNYQHCEYNAVFAGFAPARAPQLAVLVVIDEPHRHHYGGLVAAPVFREIVHESFNYLNIPPEPPVDRLDVSGKAFRRGA